MLDKIEVLTHNSIRIQSEAGMIYADPFQVKEDYHDAAYILVTHDHYDHFSPKDIAKIATPDTILVVPVTMQKKAQEAAEYVGQIVCVEQTDTIKVGNLTLETIPAYNILKPFHTKGAGWVGYIICVDGCRIYVAGDIDEIKEAKEVKCDIALVPIGGTYTMNPKSAADLINTIRPKAAIPTHYGNIIGNPKDAETFASLVDDGITVEAKIKF